MGSFTSRFTRLAASLVITTALTFGAALPAFADTGTGGGDTNLIVTGGSLQFTSAPTLGNLTGVTLDGTKKNTTATLSTFTIADATGTGTGWHVTAQAQQFAEWDTVAGDYKASGRTLPTGSLTMAQPTATKATDTTSAIPTVATGPYTLDNGSQQIASAAVDAGMGTYDFTATTLTLTLMPNVYATKYRSTLTVSVITAP